MAEASRSKVEMYYQVNRNGLLGDEGRSFLKGKGLDNADILKEYGIVIPETSEV